MTPLQLGQRHILPAGLRVPPTTHPVFLSSHPAPTLEFLLQPLLRHPFLFLSTPHMSFQVQVNPYRYLCDLLPLGAAVCPQLLDHESPLGDGTPILGVQSVAGGTGEVLSTPSGRQWGLLFGLGCEPLRGLLLRTETLQFFTLFHPFMLCGSGQVTWLLWALHLLLMMTITGLIRPLLYDIHAVFKAHWWKTVYYTQGLDSDVI